MLKGDLTSTSLATVLHDLAAQADAVIHLASVDTSAPGGAGITGVAHVAHAAARAGARLLFVSQAAGPPELYQPAEALVSGGWAHSESLRGPGKIMPRVAEITRSVRSRRHPVTRAPTLGSTPFPGPATPYRKITLPWRPRASRPLAERRCCSRCRRSRRHRPSHP